MIVPIRTTEVKMVQTRPLGKTGIRLTTLGLGTWSIAGGGWSYGWGDTDPDEARKTIHTALDQGINWIDTAPVYGLGRAESLVGEVLRERGQKVFIATKCGLVWNRKGKIRPDLSPNSIRQECEASLKRLGMDTIDLYQIHWPIPEQQIEAAWETLHRLKEEGKIRFAGVCNFSVSQLKRIQHLGTIDSVQPEYSLIARAPEEELFPFCAGHQIGIVVYSPLGSGLLTGKMTVDRVKHLPGDDWRKRHPRFDPAFLQHFEPFLEEFRKIASEFQLTPSQLALAWVLRRPEVTSAIVGARRPIQLEESARVMDITWSDAMDQAIQQLVEKYERLLKSVPSFG